LFVCAARYFDLELSDVSLITAAMRVLGLRCKMKSKIQETVTKEDLDAYPKLVSVVLF